MIELTVDALLAGRELDARVAKAMGKPLEWEPGGEPILWDKNHTPIAFTKGRWIDKSDDVTYLHVTDGYTGMIHNYSTNLLSAWEIVSWLKQNTQYDKFVLQSVRIGANFWRFWIGNNIFSGSPMAPFDVADDNWIHADASTEPLAICKAFLKAMTQ